MTRPLIGNARFRTHVPWLTALALISASVSVAPSAAADSADSLAAAVMAVRRTACNPLRANPIVEQAADEVNDSYDKWLNHAARAIPVPDATPLLKDLGYEGATSVILLGAGRTSADSIKALLLQGYLKIPDCSYIDYGVSSIHNAAKDLILTAVVLAA